MASETIYLLKEVRIRRSNTPGYRPPTTGDLALKSGEMFVNMADGVLLIGTNNLAAPLSFLAPGLVPLTMPATEGGIWWNGDAVNGYVLHRKGSGSLT